MSCVIVYVFLDEVYLFLYFFLTYFLLYCHVTDIHNTKLQGAVI